jgi:predicted nuclease with TOPRIM domain
MNEKVMIVADRAAEGLNALVRKRKGELEGLKEELETLEKELARMEPMTVKNEGMYKQSRISYHPG